MMIVGIIHTSSSPLTLHARSHQLGLGCTHTHCTYSHTHTTSVEQIITTTMMIFLRKLCLLKYEGLTELVKCLIMHATFVC